MLEIGARFTNDLYIKTSFDPDDASCNVIVEYVHEGEPTVMTGEVTWNE